MFLMKSVLIVSTIFLICNQVSSQINYYNFNLDRGRFDGNLNLDLKDSFLFTTLAIEKITNKEIKNTIYKITKETGEIIDSIDIHFDSCIIFVRELITLKDFDVYYSVGDYIDTRTNQSCIIYLKLNLKDMTSTSNLYCVEEVQNQIRSSIPSNQNTIIGIGVTDLNGYAQFYMVEFDSLGHVLKEKVYGPPGYQEAWSVVQLPDNGYVIAGSVRQGSEFKNDLMLVCTDKEGNQQWLRKYGGPNHDGDRNNVTVLKNGNILMATCRHAPSSTHYDSWLAIINPSNGNIIKEQYYESEWNNCFYTKPIELDDGSIILGGYRGVVNSDSSAVVRYASITKINLNGSVIWDRLVYFNPERNNYLFGLSPDKEGGFWGYGTTFGSNQDGWLIKVDSLGCPFPDCDSISVNTWEISTEAGISLRAYPNPATQNAIIHYQFSKQVASPMLEIFDLHGKLITRLPLNGEAPQGDVWMDLSDWVSGLYVMRIVSKGQVLATGKMLKG